MATRLIAASDAAALADLHARCFDPPWSAAQIVGSLALPTTRGWVDGSDGGPRGFILCQRVDDAAEILTLCVDPTARRQGIARHLLDSAAIDLHHSGVTRLWLDAAADNRPALQLYEAAGFMMNGRRRGYYPRSGGAVDAVLLEKTLVPAISTAV